MQVLQGNRAKVSTMAESRILRVVPAFKDPWSESMEINKAHENQVKSMKIIKIHIFLKTYEIR